MGHVDGSDAKSGNKNGQRAGTVRWRNGKGDVRLSLGPLGRKTFALPTCKTEREAEARRAVLAELGGKLLATGKIDMGLPLLERAAAAEGRDLSDIAQAVDLIAKGQVSKKPTTETTFRDVAKLWLSGELTRQFKDHVKPRKEAEAHLSQLESYVFPVIGHIPMSRFTLAHAQEAMRRLPDHYSPGTRRCVALLIHRIAALAVFPLNLLPYQPLPKGFVPPKPPRKAMAHLYPDEEAQLLGCRTIPLADRILYGFLDREGMRSDEAFRIERPDLDLKRGAIALDKNKTNDPRAWALSPDVTRSIEVWLKLSANDHPKLFHRVADRKQAAPDPKLVFYPRSDLAQRLRQDLQEAGVKREILFEHNETRQRMRAHDLRATFITIGLANGRTETWIMDRTGHRSSEMVNSYRRAARTFAELGLGPLRPMDEVIPEIAEYLRAEREANAKANGGKATGTKANGATTNEHNEPAAHKAAASAAKSTTARRPTPSNGHGAESATTSNGKANKAASKGGQRAGLGRDGDVAATAARWSLAGPRVSEASRAVPSRSKNAAKDRSPRRVDTPAPISK